MDVLLCFCLLSTGSFILLLFSLIEIPTSPKCPYAALASIRNEDKKRKVVSCNNNSGWDHLQRRQLLDHLRRENNSDTPPNHTSFSLDISEVEKTDKAIMKRPWRSYQNSRHNSYSTEALTSNFVFSDKRNCPPPLFTIHQKKLVIQAWEKINHQVEKVK